jgi:hypothetical protein
MDVHWGNLLIGVILGAVLAHLLMRVNAGGGKVQQSPS